MKKILIATGNKGKKKEMLSFFQGIKGIEFLSLKDFPEGEEPACDYLKHKNSKFDEIIDLLKLKQVTGVI